MGSLENLPAGGPSGSGFPSPYTPPAAMQASGVVQQAYAAPTATPSVLTMVAGQIPYGGVAGILVQIANFFYRVATKTLGLLGSGVYDEPALELDSPLIGGVFSSAQTDYKMNGTKIVSHQVFGTPGVATLELHSMISANAIDGFGWGDVAGVTALSLLPNRHDGGIGSANVNANGAVSGFCYLPTVAGDPTGVPASLASFINMVPAEIKTAAGAEAIKIYVNGAWRTAELGDGWQSIGPRRAFVCEDFFPGFNQTDLKLTPFNLGGAFGLQPNEAGHPGIMKIDANAGAALVALFSDTGYGLAGGGAVEIKFAFRIPTLPTNTDQFTTYVGLAGNLPENGNQVLIRYVNNVNGGKIQYTTKNGGTETAIDSGLTPIAGTWYYLTIAVNAAASSITFTINGANSGTIATNIPAAATPLAAVAQVIQNAGNGGAIDVDFFSFEQIFTTARA